MFAIVRRSSVARNMKASQRYPGTVKVTCFVTMFPLSSTFIPLKNA